MKIVLIGTDVFCTDCRKLIRIEHDIIKTIQLDATEQLTERKLEGFGSEDAVYVIENTPPRSLLHHRKWIVMNDFVNVTLYNPLSSLNSNFKYYGVLIGMSHSQCGIDIETIHQNKWYKESAPSLDLFLHHQFFKMICEHHYGSIKCAERIIIEIPYYIFNYDLSRFGDFTNTKLHYFSLVNNFHNINSCNDKVMDIEYFLLFESIFNEMPIPTVSSENAGKISILKDVFHAWKSMTNRDKVWTKLYDSTIQENIKIFSELIEYIKNKCPYAQIKILVMPFNPAFRICHKREIRAMRGLFYEQMEKNKLTVIDDFERINDFRCFGDQCHLNGRGVLRYKERIPYIIQ